MPFRKFLQSLEATPNHRKKQVFLCWLWFFLVLFGYYLIKPLRDAIGTPLADRLGDLYLVTFISTIVLLPIYSRLVDWLPRKQVVQCVYHLTAFCLIAFYIAFEQFNQADHLPRWLAATFFVWVSVFNLLVVTVFWSVMVDVFTSDESKLWFGSMAAAGSLGSLTGSVVSKFVSEHSAPNHLLIVSTIAFELIVLTAWLILRTQPPLSDPNQLSTAPPGLASSNQQASDESEVGGTFWEGVTNVFQSRYLSAICLFVLLGKFASTFIYNNLQKTMGAEMPDAQQRTVLFAHMSIWIQSFSLVLQAVGVSLLMQLLGVGVSLAIPCGLLLAMFAWLSIQDSLNVLVVSQVLQSILGYGLLVPVQHVLFTVVSREDKYKSKAFIDMIVFRASDVAASQTCQRMLLTGATVATMSLWMMPALVAMSAVAIFLGLEYRRRQNSIAQQ